MSRDEERNNGENHGFPRVSGDEPTPMSAVDLSWTFSPRERG